MQEKTPSIILYLFWIVHMFYVIISPNEIHVVVQLYYVTALLLYTATEPMRGGSDVRANYSLLQYIRDAVMLQCTIVRVSILSCKLLALKLHPSVHSVNT